ncbi:protein of unknown function [Limnospira indica PCC 8005]|uniref:Uncharacterized protein n=1 Tax=Limnospira indica PCC 8005 TaxID=376219 RepID=A0A9P1KJL0_9CYAN|nr:protein of unknown function [Limnospira indica PCC 8005]
MRSLFRIRPTRSPTTQFPGMDDRYHLPSQRLSVAVLSQPGEINHSDALTVATSLNLSLQKGPCTIVIHPQWGTAVYPSVLISSAPPDEINKAIDFAGYRVAPTHKPHR